MAETLKPLLVQQRQKLVAEHEEGSTKDEDDPGL